MFEHICYIGILNENGEGGSLATLQDVDRHIEDNIEFNEWSELEGYPMRQKVWTMREYGDWRRNTDLTRFKYCPECGKKIDWKKIREDER